MDDTAVDHQEFGDSKEVPAERAPPPAGWKVYAAEQEPLPAGWKVDDTAVDHQEFGDSKEVPAERAPPPAGWKVDGPAAGRREFYTAVICPSEVR